MSIVQIPAGLVPDSSANWGLHALQSNVNNYSETKQNVTTAGTNSTLTATQALCGALFLNTGASGGFTITFPSTAAIIAALGPTIPVDGSYSEPLWITNNGVGQTGTVTAGDASTTLTGTMTIATNTTRKFLLTVTAPTTITIQNQGSLTL
jgi:hypothetical protein